MVQNILVEIIGADKEDKSPDVKVKKALDPIHGV